MKKLTEKQIIALLGIAIGASAGIAAQLTYKLADAKLDLILKKLDMKEEFPGEESGEKTAQEASAEESPADEEPAGESGTAENENDPVTEDMFED